FPEHDGFTQHVLPAGTAVPVEVVDGAASEVDDHIAASVAHRFDLAAEIPLRATVIRRDDGATTVVLLLNHIATDEWSDAPLLRDLDHAYRTRRDQRPPRWDPLPVQYTDYTAWS
uniref:condensation domain-containing protein n=1 Tax=Mycobacterium pseudoshottsii TaxID=265949 RepID=UPI0021F3BA6C